MEFYNFISEGKSWSKETAQAYLKLFAPLMPHMTEELWEGLNLGEGSVHFATWPTFDDNYLVADEVVIPIQVNGKRRGEITMASSDIQNKEKAERLGKEEIVKHLEGKEVRKVIYVPGKILNFVV